MQEMQLARSLPQHAACTPPLHPSTLWKQVPGSTAPTNGSKAGTLRTAHATGRRGAGMMMHRGCIGASSRWCPPLAAIGTTSILNHNAQGSNTLRGTSCNQSKRIKVCSINNCCVINAAHVNSKAPQSQTTRSCRLQLMAATRPATQAPRIVTTEARTAASQVAAQQTQPSDPQSNED